jgi:hypothetical protein
MFWTFCFTVAKSAYQMVVLAMSTSNAVVEIFFTEDKKFIFVFILSLLNNIK